MSRSHRKPYWTDQQKGSTRWVKRAANRAIRNLKLKDVPPGKQYRKYFSSWKIRDWSFYDPKSWKAKRK